MGANMLYKNTNVFPHMRVHLLVCTEATGASCSVTVWTDDLRLVGNLMQARLRFTRHPSLPPPPLSLPLISMYPVSSLPLSRVARQAAASPWLGINSSASHWLLPPRCRNNLFPGHGRGRRSEEGGAGLQREGMVGLLNANPLSAETQHRHEALSHFQSIFLRSSWFHAEPADMCYAERPWKGFMMLVQPLHSAVTHLTIPVFSSPPVNVVNVYAVVSKFKNWVNQELRMM